MDQQKALLLFFLAFSLITSLASCNKTAHVPSSIILATTTSTEDSGLLGVLIPAFEEKYGIGVKVISVGTGQAMTIGQQGDADVLLVHDRSREDAFVADGYGAYRLDVMVNDFILIGPEDDPAGVQYAQDIAESFAFIAKLQSSFVSRGDQSGTHSKEISIWHKAGIEPQTPWYISAGQGMSAVLLMADEMQAYALSDRATYLKYIKDSKISLKLLFEGDAPLLNPYGVIPLNPDRHPDVNFKDAELFARFITSLEGQSIIEVFGVDDFGSPLFFPDSEEFRQNFER